MLNELTLPEPLFQLLQEAHSSVLYVAPHVQFREGHALSLLSELVVERVSLFYFHLEFQI